MNDELNKRRRLGHADGSAPPDRSSISPMGPDSHLNDELLAGYLDDPDTLAAAERAMVEQHLAACANCRQTLDELRAVVAALATLPEIAPQKSFALTHAMVGQRGQLRTVGTDPDVPAAPIDMRRTTAWHERQMRAVRWATVAAAILFVFVLSADFTTNRFFLTPDERDAVVMSNRGSEPSSMQAPETMEAEDQPGAAGAAMEDAAGTSDEMRTTSEDAPPAEADGAEDTFMVSGEVDDAGKEEALQYQDGAAGDEVAEIAGNNPRSMSTPQHYWRLAQVGLAMLIVWLLAAMIALPRIRSGNRRE